MGGTLRESVMIGAKRDEIGVIGLKVKKRVGFEPSFAGIEGDP
jgi:hypothetical protein